MAVEQRFEYSLVESDNTGELVAEVNRLIVEEKWLPIGGPAAYVLPFEPASVAVASRPERVWFVQAMLRQVHAVTGG